MKLRRYLSIPLGIGLALGIGFACAQVINKAIQLSQDATGAFGVDTNNGVYFPGHILSPPSNAPAPSVTGTGTPTISGTDFAGQITMGTSATTAVVLFGAPFNAAPTCVLGWPAVLAAETYSEATTGINITQTSTSGNKINYICPSQK